MSIDASSIAPGERPRIVADGETISAAILSPSDAAFELREAAPPASSLHPVAQAPVTGVRKLAIRLEAVGEATIAVEVGPGADPERQVQPLDEWPLEALTT